MRILCVSVVVLLAGISGCAGKRPVLYPNDHLYAVGRETADEEIADCMRLAKADVGRGGEGVPIGEAAIEGATGAATGAAGGAVVGRAGTGAAIGAAAGSTRGLMRGLFRKREPDATYQSYVNRCLRERGYDPIGWR